MNADVARFLRFAGGLPVLVALGWVLTGQAAKPPQPEISLVTDWSHRHLIFSQPANEETSRLVSEDPRYWQQLIRRGPRVMLPAADEVNGAANALESPTQWRGHSVHRDWAQDLNAGGTVGAANFPAKFSLNINAAACASNPKPDFVIFNTGLASSATQASVVAYDNLYSGCTGAKPLVYWAYDTGGQVLTSPTYSLDGAQVAFVQTKGGIGTVVLLKWAASGSETVSAPLTLTPVAPSAYQSCPAPCMTTLNLKTGGGGNTDDTTSSFFYDYSGDVAWVGGSGGWLHKIGPVFKGTPAEITNGGFPVQVNTGNALSDPVYDHVSKDVFVGDAGGFLYRVDAGTAKVNASGRLDFGVGIVEGPIVDSAGKRVYVFASSDGSATCNGGAACAAVYQLPTNFAAGATGSKVVTGTSTIFPAVPSPMYAGSFDSTYENSGNATGNLYVCGNTGGPPILYQVPIKLGAMAVAKSVSVVSNSLGSSPCSPVSDVPNANTAGGATEWIFASVQQKGVANGCASGGCVFNFKDTPWLAKNAYVVGQEVLDSNLNIQVVIQNGTSGASAPVWKLNPGAATLDPNNAGAHWLNQGPISAFTLPSWQANKAYALGVEVLDSNNNVELVTKAGTSAAAQPVWATTAGLSVNDGSVRWRDVGASATAALKSAGGTSGIIIDNIVISGTLAGTSQVYFSTLGNQACGSSGTGGCAVQASQAGLQ